MGVAHDTTREVEHRRRYCRPHPFGVRPMVGGVRAHRARDRRPGRRLDGPRPVAAPPVQGDPPPPAKPLTCGLVLRHAALIPSMLIKGRYGLEAWGNG